MKLSTRGLRILKTVHVILISMWVGGALALIVMVNALKTDGGPELYGYLYAMKIVDDLIIIPGAMGNLLIGFLYGFFTNWGFFKFRWVTVKWILTVAQILFGTFVLGPLLNGSVLLAGSPGADYSLILQKLQMLNILGTAQVSLLIFMAVISIFKPWKNLK